MQNVQVNFIKCKMLKVNVVMWNSRKPRFYAVQEYFRNIGYFVNTVRKSYNDAVAVLLRDCGCESRTEVLLPGTTLRPHQHFHPGFSRRVRCGHRRQCRSPVASDAYLFTNINSLGKSLKRASLPSHRSNHRKKLDNKSFAVNLRKTGSANSS